MSSAAKLRKFFEFTSSLAELSHCKRAKVGCVICDREFTRVLSIGYNGPPAGISNASCTGVEGNCGCVHAEANALIKLGTADSAIMLCTSVPCYHCAGLIVNSKKIDLLYHKTFYRDDRGMKILRASGIEVIHYNMPVQSGVGELKGGRYAIDM